MRSFGGNDRTRSLRLESSRALGPPAAALCLLLVGAGCAPELGDEPFACGGEGVCPDGYSCRAMVCVRDGVLPSAGHLTRSSWINPPEMFWFASSDGGATLLYNDGFTAGNKGIFQVHITPDGSIQGPLPLLPYGDGPALSSAIVLLPDGRYGVATVGFPSIDEDQTTLSFLGIERDAPSGTTPGVEKLFGATTPYLGGVEPPYVGAVADGTTVDIAWATPSQGGQAEVLHLERQGSLWAPAWTAKAQLPSYILPLSGDCQLFRADGGLLTLRAGFENYALTTIDAMGMMAPFEMTTDEPLFRWPEGVFALRRGDYDPLAATYSVSFVLLDAAGAVVAADTGYKLGEVASPFVGTPFEGGVLVTPVSRDAEMPTIDVGFRSPTEALRVVASVARPSREPLYTARAFAVGDTAYVAWTEFHDSSMDLWVGTSPLQRAGLSSRASAGGSP